MQHTNCIGPEIAVSILTTSQNSIYSYPSPGCILYQWNTFAKKVINQLDCLKLVPCSESLGSISIDKNLCVGRCQVKSFKRFSMKICKLIEYFEFQISAVCVLNQNVYVGTSWGCLIVAEAATLTPITVFRPYEEEVQYISVIPSENSSSSAVIVSVGKGYRSLINRYTDVDTTKEKKNHQTHCILWRAEHWTSTN